jgi:hypothetical protein
MASKSFIESSPQRAISGLTQGGDKLNYFCQENCFFPGRARDWKISLEKHGVLRFMKFYPLKWPKILGSTATSRTNEYEEMVLLRTISPAIAAYANEKFIHWQEMPLHG